MELIYAYTRKQAIADGVLVDVTETAKEVGYPVILKATAGGGGYAALVGWYVGATAVRSSLRSCPLPQSLSTGEG